MWWDEGEGLLRDKATRQTLGWIKESNKCYKVISSNMGQGELWGHCEEKNGKVVRPLRTVPCTKPICDYCQNSAQ
jgi:hypothetical protein